MNKNVVCFDSLFKKKFAFLVFFLFMTGSFFAKTLGNATAGEMLMRIKGAGVTLNDPVFSFAGDSDGDTVTDDIDLDDDNDGILDTVESKNLDPDGDEDGDGRSNYMDVADDTLLNGDQGLTNYTDVNGDGTPDVYDADNDGIPNHLDLDSDDDGCKDVDEQFVSLTIDGDDNGFYGTGIPVVDSQGRVQAVVDRLDINYTSPLNNKVQTSSAFSITSQPYTKDILVGENAIFSLATTATNPIYKWQQSVDNGLNWTDLSDSGTAPIISGVSTVQLHLNNVPSTYNGYQYRVLVTTGIYSCYVKSTNIAKLNVSSAPLITSNGAGPTAQINIAENMTAVTTVTAVDSDVPVQTLTYSITGGADASKFTIDSLTGVLVFNTAPNFELPIDVGGDNIYDVQVTVTDDGATPLKDVQDLAITITNVNESPVITNDGGGLTAAINVPESMTAITTVTATDSDLPTQTLTYSITGGADASKFLIDPVTGVLVFNMIPNFELPTDAGVDNVYNVQVTVTDNGTVSLTDIQDIAITVTNVNENPVITSNGGGATALINVIENTTAVTIVTATDSDLPAQTLAYSITGGADALKFTINPTTGVLVFKAAPNFGIPTDIGTDNVYNVQVAVMDNGTTPLTDVQNIIVTVTNVNKAPVIKSNGGGLTALIRVSENTTIITTVTATDSDLPKQTLTYSITGGADASKFTINPATGVLVFNMAPDFEIPTDTGVDNGYNVQVTVMDNGTIPLIDVQDIEILVVNKNDAPVFTSDGGGSTATIKVHEKTTLVTTVTATDSDLPPQELIFSITGGADASKFMIFMVNSTTGVLVFKAAQNFEIPKDVGADNIYNVQVTVTDNGATPLTDVQNIAITVIKVNKAPIAVKNNEVTDENVSITLNVCTNDSDVDGSIDLGTVDLDPNTAGIQTSLTTTRGKWSVDSLGIVTFTPALDFVGTAVIFYTVKDNLGLVSNTTEITVLVNDVPAVKKPGIALVKTAEFNDLNGDESANIGETITYNFEVTNTGDFPLTNVKVTDPLSGITMANAEISLNIEESDSTTFTATYTLTQDDIVRGNVTNQATVVGTSPDGIIVKDLSDDSNILENNPTVTPVSGCSIKVFNALTPEGQTKNKVLYIRGIECYPDNRLEVYNRWGVLVYEGEHYNNIDNVFEGISKGRVTIGASQVLPAGTYFYSLKYKDSNANGYEKSGYLYLTRD